MSQQEAAAWLGLSTRQVKRLWKDYQREGVRAVVSRQRGRPSNHQLAATIKTQALDLIRKHYHDFGPTLAHEKLREVHGLELSVESVRQLMIGNGLWRAKRARRAVAYQLRERRERHGELVQIDGSPHAWFETRGPRCTLLVFIDDATSRLNHLQFVPSETTWAYLNATRAYVQCHGRPLAFYSDKHSIFRVTAAQAVGGSGITQYGRVLQELDIEIICANTPQAKGRVERANGLLQDRLVKEMRLHNINDMESGNCFLPEYQKLLNQRFQRTPHSPEDAHRPLTPMMNVNRLFSLVEDRVLSKNLTVQYSNTIYQIQTTRPVYSLRHKPVQVRESQDGSICIEYNGQSLDYTCLQERSPQARVLTAKELNSLEFATAKHRPRYHSNVDCDPCPPEGGIKQKEIPL